MSAIRSVVNNIGALSCLNGRCLYWDTEQRARTCDNIFVLSIGLCSVYR